MSDQTTEATSQTESSQTADPAAETQSGSSQTQTRTQTKTEAPRGGPLPESVREELAQGREARREAAELRQRMEAIETQMVRDREDLQLARAGWTDPDALDLLRYQHGRLPEADRPDLIEYAQGLTAETAPRHLAVYLPGGQQGEAPPVEHGQPPVRRAATPQPAPGTSPTGAPPTGGDAAGDLREATAKLASMRPGQPGYDEARSRVSELAARVKASAYRR